MAGFVYNRLHGTLMPVPCVKDHNDDEGINGLDALGT